MTWLEPSQIEPGRGNTLRRVRLTVAWVAILKLKIKIFIKKQLHYFAVLIDFMKGVLFLKFLRIILKFLSMIFKLTTISHDSIRFAFVFFLGIFKRNYNYIVLPFLSNPPTNQPPCSLSKPWPALQVVISKRWNRPPFWIFPLGTQKLQQLHETQRHTDFRQGY